MTHYLPVEQAAQRALRGEGFLMCLGMYKTRLIFTMDETLVTLNDIDKDPPIYYVGKEKDVPNDFKKTTKKFYPKQVMVAFGICWNGMSRAYFVEPKAKVNAPYFVEHILAKMVLDDIPRLYPLKREGCNFAHGFRSCAYRISDRDFFLN